MATIKVFVASTAKRIAQDKVVEAECRRQEKLEVAERKELKAWAKEQNLKAKKNIKKFDVYPRYDVDYDTVYVFYKVHGLTDMIHKSLGFQSRWSLTFDKQEAQRIVKKWKAQMEAQKKAKSTPTNCVSFKEDLAKLMKKHGVTK